MDARTISSILKGGLVGILAPSILAGIYGVSSFLDSRELDTNAQRIEDAIEADDYALAEKLLDSLDLEEADHIRFDLKIEREEALEEFSDYLDEGELAKARDLHEEWDSARLFDDQRLDRLEQRIEALTEQGLSERILFEEGGDVTALCRTYLDHYPGGEHRPEVVQRLVYNGVDEFIQRIEDGASFESSYQALRKANRLLDTYSSDVESLPGKLMERAKGITGDVSVAKDIFEKGKQNLRIGATVRVHDTDPDSWNEEFAYERDTNFPEGSVGTVIAREGKKILVRFSDIEALHWSRDWSPTSDYWSDGKKNVADYWPKELVRLVEPDALQKERFSDELDRFKKLMSVYADDMGYKVF